MARNIFISLLLFSLPSLRAEADTSMVNSTNVLKHMISMEEFNGILMTETPMDYGDPLSSEEGDKMWFEATAFQWAYNKMTSYGFQYAPYVVCSLAPGLSGNERFEAVYELLDEAAALLRESGTEVYVFPGDGIYNDDEKTCRLVSTMASVFTTTIETQPPEKTEYLQCQPSFSSMKMIEGTFNAIAKGMKDYDCTDECADDVGVITVSGDVRRLMSGLTSESTVKIVVELTPFVLYFLRDGNVTYAEVIDELKSFSAVEDVTTASFYAQATSQDEKVSDRMQFYSNVIANVSAMTDDSTGMNLCIDEILTRDIKFEQIAGNETIGITVESISPDLTEQELDDCLWYMVHALTVNPYVKQMDTKQIVVPLDPSGSTSLLTSGLRVAALVASVSWLLQFAI